LEVVHAPHDVAQLSFVLK
jgi:hypothetical protein